MTCNGALPNCKLCKILSSNLTSNDSGFPYKMLNSYTDENRDLYLRCAAPSEDDSELLGKFICP